MDTVNDHVIDDNVDLFVVHNSDVAVAVAVDADGQRREILVVAVHVVAVAAAVVVAALFVVAGAAQDLEEDTPIVDSVHPYSKINK